MEGAGAASNCRRCSPAHKIAAQPLRSGRAAVPRARQRTKFMIASVPTSRRRCRCSPSSCSHHLQLKQPNPATEHRRVDVSFSRGLRAGSGSKGCSLGVMTRCVTAGGHSPRDICSTLPARRAGRQRFAMSVGRRYMPRSSALRVRHRVLTGT